MDEFRNKPNELTSRFVAALVIALRWVTGIDPSIWEVIPFWNKAIIAAEFALLFMVAMISGVAWCAFWGMSGSWYTAILVGLFAFVLMWLLDRLIAGSDWRLSGIYARADTIYGWAFAIRFGFRVLIGSVSSLATSTGAEMAMFNQAIVAKIEQTVREDNQKIEDSTEKAITTVKERETGYQAKQLSDYEAIAGQLTREVDQAQQASTEATQRVRITEAEMDREKTGKDGRARGIGPKFRDAENRHDQAVADLAKADGVLAIYRPRFADAQANLKLAAEAYSAVLLRIQPKIDELERAKAASLEKVRQDPALSYMALGKIYADPETGPAARWFGHLMLAVLLTIEVSYIVVMTVFRQASVYQALLIQDAKNRRNRIRPDDMDDPPGNDNHANDNFAPIKFIPWERSPTETAD